MSAGAGGGRLRRRFESETARPEGELVVGEVSRVEGMLVASHPAALRVAGDHGAADVEAAVAGEDGDGRGTGRTLGRRQEIGADHAAAADAAGTEVVGAREGAGRKAARTADAFARQGGLGAANAAAA